MVLARPGGEISCSSRLAKTLLLSSALLGQVPVMVISSQPVQAATVVLPGQGNWGCAYEVLPDPTTQPLNQYVVFGGAAPGDPGATVKVQGGAFAGQNVVGGVMVQAAAQANVTVAANATTVSANLGTTTSTTAGGGPPSISTTQSSNTEALDYVRERREAQASEQVQTVASTETASDAGQAAEEPAQAEQNAQPKKKKATAAAAEAASEAAPKAAAKVKSKAAADVVEDAAVSEAPKAKTLKKAAVAKPAKPAVETVADDGVLTADAVGLHGVRQGSNGAWVQGFGDYERHKNLAPGEASNTTRYQRSAGALVGLDHTFDLSSYDTRSALTIGVIGGGLDVHTKFDDTSVFRDSRTSQSGGFVGLYGSYTRGNFAMDGIFKTDLLDHHEQRVTIDRTTEVTVTAPKTTTVETRTQDCPAGTVRISTVTQNGAETTLQGNTTVTVGAVDKTGTANGSVPLQALGGPTTTTKDVVDLANSTKTTKTTVLEHLEQGSVSEVNYNFGTNMYYRIALDDHRYIEPTAGILYTITDYGSGGAALGLDDGRVLRVQGGARIGTQWEGAGGLFYNVSLLGLAYSDVLVKGYTLSSSTLASDASAVDEGKLRALAAFETVIQDHEGHTFQLTAELRGGQDVIGFGGRAAYRIQW